jgi:dolichyl-phosphate-mannose-protein mannosyltransferase
MQEEVPEPIKNVFEDPDVQPEEQTTAPVGPVNEVQMNPSTSTVPLEPVTDKIEDLRKPVGLDAGAPEVTDVNEDEGGWHGGAEENNKRQKELLEGTQDADKEKERQRLEEPETGEIKVKQMEVDDEARRLADEVMKAYEVVEP